MPVQSYLKGETVSIHFTPCEIFIQPDASEKASLNLFLHVISFAEHVLAVLADRDRHRDRADGDGVAGGGGAEPRGDRAAGPRHRHAPLRRLLRAAREGEAEEGRQRPRPGQLRRHFMLVDYILTFYTQK